MTLDQWLNIIAVAVSPLLAGLISVYHKQNRDRWAMIFVRLDKTEKRTRRTAKKAERHHEDIERRLLQLEQVLDVPRNVPIRGAGTK